MDNISKIYFPNLNGLRFTAAFLVIIHHLELVAKDLGITSSKILQNPFSGQLGVILFFVLSGFLITYLLLIEEKQTKTISIKDFYIRRVLRIWPLYYLLIILAFFVIRYIPFFDLSVPDFYYSTKNLILFLLILPNVALFRAVVPYISQTWSIGVEEQFYIIWPILMKYIKAKFAVLVGVIIVYLSVKFILLPCLISLYPAKPLIIFQSVWNWFNIDAMAIGGLFAYCHFKKSVLLKYLYNPVLNWVILLGLITTFFTTFHIPHLNTEFYAILFGIIILNLATNPKPIINLENPILNYLGKISYGLYMYHLIGIVISIKLLNILGIHYWIVQATFSTAITIAIASISYHFFEKRFISMKKRFSKVISGENARPH